MTFWAALKEAFLEMLIGSRQLEAWRAERKQREECERVMRGHLEEAGRAMRQDEYRIDYYPAEKS